MNNFIHATANLEKTTAFYRDVFGLDQPAPPRPPNPAVPALIGVPGAQLQVQIFRLPGAFGFELSHFGAIELKGAQGRPTDPGVAGLSIRVRDLEPVLAAIRKVGAPIVTRSGAPVKFGSKGQILSIIESDPDGYGVEALQVPAATDSPAAGNILGASMGLTVGDLERTARFYRDLLGFELTGKMEFSSDKATLDAMGAPDTAQFRQLAGNVPGTKAHIGFYEFSGVPRTPFRLRVPDPGCPAIALRVADLDGLLARMKAAGVKIVSTGGVPAQFSPTIRNIFVEDPDGFKIELYQVSQ
jgi:catechol 2,3-dioxygenase-like lactoylglutathione lyase family enzyme